MAKPKFPEAKILEALTKAEQGSTVKEVAKEYGVSPATFYNWKHKYKKKLKNGTPSQKTAPIPSQKVEPSAPSVSPSKRLGSTLGVDEARKRIKALEQEARNLKVQLADRILSSEDI